jgi:hypothetical protein
MIDRRIALWNETIRLLKQRGLRTCPDCKGPYWDWTTHKDPVIGSCPYPEEEVRDGSGEVRAFLGDGRDPEGL